MLSSDEHPGLFTFMVGLIVLVMAGVGLSLVVDRRFHFSNGVVELRREAKLAESEISELKTLNSEAAEMFANRGVKRQADAQANKRLAEQLQISRKRQSELVKTRNELAASVSSLEESFSQCRADYRRKTRSAAVGENLGTLTLRSGRTYLQAVIRRVTDVGIEIQHADGIARVQGPELDPKFQDRFQWDDEERRARLKEEHENLADFSGSNASNDEIEVVATAPTPRELRKIKSAEESQKRDALRQSVRNWKAKVGQLATDQAEAASHNYGNKSVPGSLETWAAKAARLKGELARARAALAMAKADLAVISPSDPLLAPEAEF